jgi:hypothetical protein
MLPFENRYGFECVGFPDVNGWIPTNLFTQSNVKMIPTLVELASTHLTSRYDTLAFLIRVDTQA